MTERALRTETLLPPTGALACGCCEGVAIRTAAAIQNRPGLSALSYRRGAHAAFFESMIAKIATYGARQDDATRANEAIPTRHLRDMLTTRDRGDAAIALLDAWATVADVITFYQERLANEGFLRTAREPRSLYELSRLVGYRPRPGISSTVHLAFEVEDTSAKPGGATTGAGGPPTSSTEILIPAGVKAKSTPTPGSEEEPQTFETSVDLLARPEWSAIKPRKNRPMRLTVDKVFDVERIYLKGTGLRIAPSCYLAFKYDKDLACEIRQVVNVEEIASTQTTILTLVLGRLSSKKLIQEVMAAIDRFYPETTPPSQIEAANQPPAKLLADGFADFDAEMRETVDEFKGLLNAWFVNLAPLSTIDSDVQRFVCERFIGRDALPQSLLHAIGTLTSSPASQQISLESLFDTSAVASYFREVVKTHVESFQRTDTALQNIDAAFTNDGVDDRIRSARVLAEIKLQLSRLRPPSTKGMAIATVSDGNVDPGSPLAAAYVSGDLSPESMKLVFAEIVPLGSTPAPALSDFVDASYLPAGAGRIVPKQDAVPKPEDLSRALRALKPNVADADLLVRLSDGTRMLAECIQRTTSASGHADQYSLTPQGRVLTCSRGIATHLGIDLIENGTADEIAAVRIRLQAIGPAPSNLGQITCGTPGIKTTPATSNSPVYVLTYVGSDAPSEAFHSAFSDLKYTSEAEFSQVSVLIEVFKVAVPDAAEGHQNCIGAGLVDIHVFGDLPREDPTRTVLGGLSRLHDDLATGKKTLANLAAEFSTSWWPGDENLASQGRDHLFGTNGLMHMGDLSLTQSAEIVGRRITDSDVNEPWNVRFKQLESALSVVMTEMVRNGGASPHPLTTNKPTGRKGLTDVMVAAYAATAPLDVLEKRVAGYSDLIGVVKSAHVFVHTGLQGFESKKYLFTAADYVNNLRKTFQVHLDRLNVLKESVERSTEGISKEIASILADVRMQFCLRVLQPVQQGFNFFKTLRTRAPIETFFHDRLKSLQDEFDQKSKQLATGVSTETLCGSEDETSIIRLVTQLRNQLSGDAEPAGVNPRGLDSALQFLAGESRGAAASVVSHVKALISQVSSESTPDADGQPPIASISDAIARLEQLSSQGPFNRESGQVFDFLRLLDTKSDFIAQLSKNLDATQRSLLTDFLRNATVAAPIFEPKVYVFRSRANLFGWSAPPFVPEIVKAFDPPLTGKDPERMSEALRQLFCMGEPNPNENAVIYLDGNYSATSAGSPVAILLPLAAKDVDAQKDPEYETREVRSALIHPRTAYGVHGNVTHVVLDSDWRRTGEGEPSFQEIIRNTSVLCDAQRLELAEEPISEYLETTASIECDGVVTGLDPGRNVIIEGVQQLAGGDSSRPARQLLEIVDVDHDIQSDLFGDRFHTTLTFNTPLAAPYRRDSVKIYANVVEATHGETQLEVLGSGDASRPFQRFLLRRGDVSQLPAPTPTGTRSALAVHVNDVTWTQQDDLISSRPDSQDFVTPANDAEQTPVVFGDGSQGARVPTGVENVRGRYRSGLGSRGNVAASQIDQLVGAPLGVKKVVNPLRAQGGADPDGLKDIRRRAPLAVTAMDRLVSLADYADFVRNYAGVGKASAARFRGVVHITLAGLDAQAFDMDGPVIRNLRQALALYGDPTQRVRLHNREASLLIVVAKVRLAADQQWNKIEPKLRRTLLDTFSYEQADLGEDALLSDAISVVQNFAGIDYVDVDVFDAVRQDEITQLANRLTRLARRPRIHVPRERLATVRIPDKESKNESSVPPTVDTPLTVIQQSTTRLRETFQPAQLCYLPPDIPGALILEQLS
jgi:hypothetical protein